MSCRTIRFILTVAFVNAMLFVHTGPARVAKQSPTEEPVVVKAVAPVYPVIAIAAGVSGTVTAEVQIDVRGLVTSVEIVDGPKVLRAAAESTARRWVFASGNEAKPRTAHLVFSFSLMPKDTPQAELLTVFKPPYAIEIKEAKPTLTHRVDSDPPGYTKPARSRKRP